MKEDILIITGMAVVSIVVGSGIFMYGQNAMATDKGAAAGASNSVAAAVTPTVITAGQNAPVKTRTNYVITDKSDLTRLWSMLYGKNAPPLPDVNFSKDQVMAVFAGQKPTGGYTINVSKVQDNGSKRTVDVVITAPGKSCPTIQTLTSPYQIVAVPATSLPLTHADIVKTESCN